MKKFSWLVVLGLVFGIAGISVAQDSIALDKYSYIVDNSTGSYQTTVIPITSIRPKTDKYIGMKMGALDPTISSEMVFGIYDNAATACNGEVITEGENNTQFKYLKEVEFPARKLVNGITIIQGPNTRVIIDFIRS